MAVTSLEPLEPTFFQAPTPQVARALLGHRVVRQVDGTCQVARIVETEAYLGPEDPGSHATRGRHTQAARLWDAPGLAYVYVCYGIHQMLNVVAHEPGGVGAILLRAAEPVDGHAAMASRRGVEEQDGLLSGPGNLAKALAVRREDHEGLDLTAPDSLWLARGQPVPVEHIAVDQRVGLSQGSELLLRFLDETSPCLSRPVGAGGRVDA